MDRLPATSVSEHFATLTDPRAARGTEHRLVDIVTIALCAVICGADEWVAVETFGREKAGWLRTFLPLRGGIPSHDTFGRVFARLAPSSSGGVFWAGCRRSLGRSASRSSPWTARPCVGPTIVRRGRRRCTW